MPTRGATPDPAQSATPAHIEPPLRVAPEHGEQTGGRKASGGDPSPPTNDESTGTSDSAESTSSSRKTSKTSGARTSSSSKHWRQPTDARELAAQTNMVATMLLNNEIDVDTARTYAALSRVIAQVLSVTVTRARFVKTEPDLSLAWGEEDD